MKEIKLDIECKSCEGTGVYVGMCERGGSGVVCYQCDGTGCQKYSFKYTDFTKRKKCKNVKRVYIKGYGYCITPKPLTLSNGIFVDFSKEGVSYQEFLDGEMPKHIKQMACPMMADQGACHDIKNLTDRCNKENDGWVYYIPSCKCKDKEECWKLFEGGEING